MKKCLMISAIFFMILLSNLVTPITEYKESGSTNNYYQADLGLFNTELSSDEYTVTDVILSDPLKIPLITDINNDSIKEIIVLNGRNIIAFQNSTLKIMDSHLLNVSAGARFSNMIIFDIDGDGFDEIIIAEETEEKLFILNVSNTIETQKEILMDSITHDVGSFGGQFLIGCKDVDDCIISYTQFYTAGSGASPKTNELYASFFDSTSVSNEIEIEGGGLRHVFCRPKIAHMTVIDFDNDGSDEFIFTWIDIDRSTGGAEIVHLNWLNTLANGSVVFDISPIEIAKSGALVFVSNSDDAYVCDTDNDVVAWADDPTDNSNPIAEKMFTSPSVFDYDPSNDKMETVVGVMVSNDNFVMVMYDSTGTEIREFPFIQESEGQILGNIFKADIFPDSSDSDFCLMGVNYDTNRYISVTCGSLQDTSGFGLTGLQTIEFRSNNTFSPSFNISDNYDTQAVLTHSAQLSSVSRDEMINTYGAFELEIDTGLFSACFLLGNCEMNLLFQNPRSSGTVVPIDYTDEGLDDWIMLTATNLHYINDGFENRPAIFRVGGTTINPCTDSPIQLNETVVISTIMDDPENDIVFVEVIAYKNHANQQNLGLKNATSGTSIPFSFEANKTIGAGVIEFSGYDAENGEVTTFNHPFIVAPTGVQFGDCTTIISVPSPPSEIEEEDALIETTTLTDNSLRDSIENIAFLMGVPVLLFILIIMLGTNFTIVIALWRVPFLSIAVVVLSDFFIILITALMGLIGTALLVSLFAIFIIAGALFMTWSFNRFSGGG